MNDENHIPPTPEAATPPAHSPAWPTPRPVIERPRISRQRKILMAIVILVAGGALFGLRQTIDGEKASVNEAKNVLNATITSAMGHEYGGTSGHVEQLALVAKVGNAIISKSDVAKRNFKLRFHLLKAPDSINLYSLTTGDIYITTALLNRMQTEGQLAAALSHASAHVMAGDSVAAVTDISHPLPIWAHTGVQEQAADVLTVKLMGQAGYDPNAFVGMLNVLAEAYHAGADVMFFTTHPNAADRITAINASIVALYPEGVPAILSK